MILTPQSKNSSHVADNYNHYYYYYAVSSLTSVSFVCDSAKLFSPEDSVFDHVNRNVEARKSGRTW